MSQELEDEVTSINSIYGEDTLVFLSADPQIYALTLPSQLAVSLRVEFPPEYPNTPVSILGTQSVGSDAAKGEGAGLVDLVRGVLSEVYVPGSPCIFDVIDEVGLRLQQRDHDLFERSEEQRSTEATGVRSALNADEESISNIEQQSDIPGEGPHWTLSEVITEKKSVFIARAAVVTSVDQAKQYLAHLLATDKKVAKATHNMTAYRIHGENGVQYQDCDDDGETAAGGRLLHLLELMGVWNGMVVVSRWYGGVHLGPDRFRIINQTARDALVKAGFTKGGGKGGGKKGSR